MNPLSLMQLFQNGTNPQQMLINMFQQQFGNNPMTNNVIGMIQNQNANGLEQIARSLCKEKGIDPDAMLNQIRQQTGLK